LHCLNAGDVVEEPSATGVHQLRVALHLHQFQGAHTLRLGERVVLMRAEKAVGGFRAAVEHHVYISVARGPHVFEKLAAINLRERGHGVAQLVKGLAQRLSPKLVESGFAPVAAAI